MEVSPQYLFQKIGELAVEASVHAAHVAELQQALVEQTKLVGLLREQLQRAQTSGEDLLDGREVEHAGRA